MLTRLEARCFRNLEPLTWTPGPGRHLLLGGNGAGKTSLLEAIYTVATTRSFRTPRLAECVRHGERSFRISGEVEDAARTRLEISWGPAGLERAVNGSRATLVEHLDVLPVVAWTAAEVDVLTGPPENRRKFMDRGAVSARVGALDALRRYRSALRQKRELLAPAAPADRDARSDGGLAAWNRVLAAAAVEVARLRADYVARLVDALDSVLEAIGLPFPRIDLRYRPSPPCVRDGVDAVERRLERAESTELRRGLPLLGSHRDDLEILWGGHPVSRVASAGETKALSLALLAAHGQTVERAGRTPIYLLDDLDTELAPDTLAAVWTVFDTARQVVSSSNRAAVWEGLRVDSRWNLTKGRIEGAPASLTH